MKNISYEEAEAILYSDNYRGVISGCNIMKGLLIISKYIDPDKEEILCHAEHDQIWSVELDELVDAGVTKEDLEQLNKLGWYTDEGALSRYV